MMWIVIAAVVLGLIVLVAVALPVVGRLSGLRRAMERLQRRQEDATELQAGAQMLEQTLLGLQQRAETMQDRIALIKAGHGDGDGRHAFSRRR
jgi:TolA-binding protein